MQAYKIAQNKTFCTGGHEFLYLVADNALFEMDASTREQLEPWFLKNDFTREEFLGGREDDAGEEKGDFFTGLLQRHIIVPAARDVVQSKIPASVPISVPLKTLVLQLTEACNLDCSYCYYAQKRTNLGQTGRMTSAVARRAVDFLLEQSGNRRDLELVFFGGEPLLNFELLASVVRYAREKAEEKEQKIDFALTTNGTLVTPEITRFLVENRIGVTISIDGSEEIHNRFRCYPDGTPSYEVIVSNTRGLLEGTLHRPVVARVTVAKNSGDLMLVLHQLLKLGFAEVGFGPVTSDNPGYRLDNEETMLLLEQFKVLSRKFLEVAHEGAFLGFSNLIDLLVTLHEGERKQYSCGAGLGLFSVDHRGSLYLCQRFTGEEEFCMGDIFEGFDHQKLASFRDHADVKARGECNQCWVRNVCAGGCYHEAWTRVGSPVSPNVHYCEWIKQWVQTGLEIYGEISLTCPEYLDHLSWLRGVSSEHLTN